ncbi:MAG TPA: class I SAM-dependent methyltransferase [Pseudonocardia sp.]|nr:class I SAM-dependent methyltransferase [Pseudonocardia sp.]
MHLTSRRPRPLARAAVRGWLYDRLVSGLTAGWYREVLRRLPERAHVLDVGIGTGGAVARCADLVRAKDLRITGVDIDPDYIHRCRQGVARAGLDDRVTPWLASVYDHRGGPYDAVYFSASLMLLPDPVAAITWVSGQLAPGGRLFFTQTFEHRRSVLAEKIKPMIHHVTTIHFGRVTYEDDFRRVLDEAGVDLVELAVLPGTRSAGGTRQRSYWLAVGRVQDGERRDDGADRAA